MSLREWAENEVRLACEKEAPDLKEGEWDYGCACYRSALKAYMSMLDDDHSGMSWSITRNILTRLMNGRVLTPIEDNDDVWKESLWQGYDGRKSYQCVRMSSLFKDVLPDGKVEYRDIDRVVIRIIDDRTTWHNGFISGIIHEMYPITFPYYPAVKPYEVFVKELLTEGREGEYDTLGLFYVIKPDGERVDINRFFKESDDGWEEISHEEFLARNILHLKRIMREKAKEEQKNEDH